jgi:hypothetical protein
MRHLRSDYDAVQPWPDKRPHIVRRRQDGQTVNLDESVDSTLGIDPIIPADEPVFLLRGQDPAAEIAVRAWADDVERHRGDPELVRRVRDWATEMGDYARTHGNTVADVPEGALRA